MTTPTSTPPDIVAATKRAIDDNQHHCTYTDSSSTGAPAPQFCETLLREGRVLVLPGERFGDDSGHAPRLSFLQPFERIEEGMERLGAVIERLRATA